MKNWFLLLLAAIFLVGCNKKQEEKFEVIAYYFGDPEQIDKYPVEKLTQIIYSFLHLKGNELSFDNEDDIKTIQKLVSLKNKNPNLKVLFSLGGWGGCETCSDVFLTEKGRKEFAISLKILLEKYNVDGIDLDWEYPSIEGAPGHKYTTADKHDFTLLIKEIRNTIGDEYELSFAAGGYEEYLKNSIEWSDVMPLVDRVNLMSYDLKNGYSIETGHHTPLYSTSNQSVSTDYGVQYLLNEGVPASKIVIGAAFYARVWEGVQNINNGLYQAGRFKNSVSYKNFNTELNEGFLYYRDSISKAPYAFNEMDSLFATFDDEQSVQDKVSYAKENNLGGLMFWELTSDTDDAKLLGAIYRSKNEEFLNK